MRLLPKVLQRGFQKIAAKKLLDAIEHHENSLMAWLLTKERQQ
jgi:hypothetical protein